MPIFQKHQHLLLLLTILTITLITTHSKIISHNFNINNFRKNNGWEYLTRFNAQPNSFEVNITVKMNSNELTPSSSFNIQIIAIPSSIWSNQFDKKCQNIHTSYTPQNQQNQQYFLQEVSLNQNNNFTALITKTINIQSPITYYFVARDCQQILLKQGFDRYTNLEIQTNLSNNGFIYQANQHHYVWILPLFILLQYLVVHYLKKDKEEDGDNWVKLLLKISIRLSIVSILFKYIGFIIYAYINGKYYQIFDIMYLLIRSFSDSIILFLIVFLAFGWTITFITHKTFEFYLPLAFMLLFIHLVLTLINKGNDGEPNKYHMFDSFPAYIMIFFKTTLLVLFIFGLRQSYLAVPPKQTKLKYFFRQFGLFGFIYLTFEGIAIWLVEGIQAEKRQQYILFGVEGTKFLLCIWLGVLSGWRNSSYRGVIKNSFMDQNQKML